MCSSDLRGGLPLIRFDELGSPIPDGVAAGAALSLVDADARPIAVGLIDAENECLRLFPLDEGEGWNPDYFRLRVRAALDLRRRLGLVGPEKAFRWINGEGDGLSGFLVDFYAGNVVVYAYSDAFLPQARWIAESAEIGRAHV